MTPIHRRLACLSRLALGFLLAAGPAISSAHAEETQAQPLGALWATTTVATAGCLLAACPVTGLEPLKRQSPPMRATFRVTAALVTPLYAALKTAMAAAATGAASWLFLLSFDRDYARVAVEAAARGDWRIKPTHVTCEEPIRLVTSPEATRNLPDLGYPIE